MDDHLAIAPTASSEVAGIKPKSARMDNAMTWDPFLRDEIRGLREDLERRDYEEHLRRNPDEEAQVNAQICKVHARHRKNVQAFNEFVPKADAAEKALAKIRETITATSHSGLYRCAEGGIAGGFFLAKASCDPLLAWTYRQLATLISLGVAAIAAATAGPWVALGIAAACFALYAACVISCERLTHSEILNLHALLLDLRKELRRREDIVRTMNEKRIELYKACISSPNPRRDALKATYIHPPRSA
jgi:hypothetical protein